MLIAPKFTESLQASLQTICMWVDLTDMLQQECVDFTNALQKLWTWQAVCFMLLSYI